MTGGSPGGVDDPGHADMDALQRFFVRPFFLSCTIGIPFCIFKILFGLTILRAGEGALFQAAGLAITIWATADLFMNAGRSLLDLLHRPAPFEYCTIAQIGRLFKRPLIFLAFDTMLTFSIICAMLWTGWIGTLDPAEAALWYAATTMNLISLSLVSLYNEIRHNSAE